MGYLATMKAGKVVCCYLLLLFLLTAIGYSNARPVQQQLLVIISKSSHHVRFDPARKSDIYRGHEKNLQQLMEGGYLTLIGLLEKGGGIFVANERDSPHIKAALENDAIIDSGIYNYAIKPFKRVAGAICTFNEGCVETGYQLIMFLSNLNKETVKIGANMEYAHQLYLEKAQAGGLIRFSGRFDGKDGSFVIYHGRDFKDFVYNDPAVVNDYFIAEFAPFTGCSGPECPEW